MGLCGAADGGGRTLMREALGRGEQEMRVPHLQLSGSQVSAASSPAPIAERLLPPSPQLKAMLCAGEAQHQPGGGGCRRWREVCLSLSRPLQLLEP